MSRVYIDDFKSKLDLLVKYELNPVIRSQTSLAKHLDVSKATVHGWIHGDKDKGCSPNQGYLPEKWLSPFCNAFLINPEQLQLDLLSSRFEASLPKVDGGWVGLIKLARPSVELELIRVEERPQTPTELRGLGPAKSWSDSNDVEEFKLGERVQLELAGEPQWSVLVLLRDPNGVECLCPSADNPQQCLDATGALRLPSPAARGEERYFPVQHPTGDHLLLAILTKKPWGERLYQHLVNFALHRDEVLEHVARMIQNAPENERTVIEKPFYVL